MGFNSRLDSVQAAVLGVKLKYLDRWNARRRQIADAYTSALRAHPRLRPISQASWTSLHAHHLFVVRSLDGQRDHIVQALQEAGIGVGIHYPIAIHQQEGFKRLYPTQRSSFPVTERLAKEIFSLPLCGELQDAEASRIIDSLLAAVDRLPVPHSAS